jgi:hypothetical protein
MIHEKLKYRNFRLQFEPSTFFFKVQIAVQNFSPLFYENIA